MSVNVPLIDLMPDSVAAQTSPRTITTHLHPNRFPVQHLQFGGPIILLLRNPKDVAVSFYYHATKDPHIASSLDWDTFVHHFYNGPSMKLKPGLDREPCFNAIILFKYCICDYVYKL